MRSRLLGDIQLRMVEHSAGYLADHWCDKGHILLVTEGAVVLEHRDGTRYELTAGVTWHVADNGAAPHRVICEHGATVLSLIDARSAPVKRSPCELGEGRHAALHLAYRVGGIGAYH